MDYNVDEELKKYKYLNEEFKKFAKLDKNIQDYDFKNYQDYLNFNNNYNSFTNMTSTVIEERDTRFREIDVFSRLIMDRIIFLGSEVNSTISNIIVAQLLFLESIDKNSPISIYINSPGGEIYSGLSIYDTMQFIGPEIITVCTGLGASMAAILLSGGSKGKRFALKHSRIMIHQPLGGAKGQASDMEINLKQILDLKKELYEILSYHTGKSFKEIEKDSDRDYWMTSEEAKKYGIIDDIFYKKNNK